MSIAEIQNNIISKILNTKDNQLLEYVKTILTKDNYYKFSEFELQFVNDSLEEYKKGKTISQEEIFEKSEKWLEE